MVRVIVCKEPGPVMVESDNNTLFPHWSRPRTVDCFQNASRAAHIHTVLLKFFPSHARRLEFGSVCSCVCVSLRQAKSKTLHFSAVEPWCDQLHGSHL